MGSIDISGVDLRNLSRSSTSAPKAVGHQDDFGEDLEPEEEDEKVAGAPF